MESQMTEETKAWIWSRHKSVRAEPDTQATHESKPVPPADGNVVRLKLVSSAEPDLEQSKKRRIKYGGALAIGAIAGLFHPLAAMLLLVIASLLIASGKEPARTKKFLAALPTGKHVNEALLKFDKLFG